ADAAAPARQPHPVAALLDAVMTLGFSLQNSPAPPTVAEEAERVARVPPAQSMHQLPDGGLMTVTLDQQDDGTLRLMVSMAHPPAIGPVDLTVFLAPLLDAVPSAVSIKNAERRYLFVNPAWERFYGATRTEIIGHRFEEMLARNVTQETFTPLSDDVRLRDAEVLARGVSLLDREEVGVDAEGRARVWINSRIPLAEHVLGTSALLSITHDVTVMREAEATLEAARRHAEEASRAKSEFISIVTHELRTPLNAVVGFAEVCLGMTDDPQMLDYLRIIESSGKSLAQLIDDLLDMSRIESGRFALEDGPVDLTSEIKSVVRLMEPTASQKALTLAIEVDTSVPQRLRGDRKRISQILMNLLGNAMKFTHTGQITVMASLSGDVLKVQVKDTGGGIAPADQARIFEPFTQASNGEARRSSGLGLGLAICKRLVEQMQGQIGVLSTPGTGSTFWFEIPVDLRESRPARTGERLDGRLSAPVITSLAGD
ncbi:MAG: PAS domain-containing protein, partial [Rhodospirillaceae bacterium]|nr:PAS domain-containing protein [Rhodospirillaceae bacterium]